MCQKHLQCKVPRWHPNKMAQPPKWAPFDMTERHFFLPNSLLYLKGWAWTPFQGSSFWPLVCTISYFRPLPRACGYYWGMESGPTTKVRSSSPQQAYKTPTLLWMLHQSACQSLASFYPLMIRTQRYLTTHPKFGSARVFFIRGIFSSPLVLA